MTTHCCHHDLEDDFWHFLRHQWSKWSPIRRQSYIGAGIMNRGEEYTRFVQDRHCRTCNAHDLRIINPDKDA